MPTIPPGTYLGRNDVIGRTLVSIVQNGSTEPGGMDWAFSYYRLDSGAVFGLGCQDNGTFVSEIVPEDAGPIEHPLIDHVLGQQIVQVLRDGPESGMHLDSPYLVLQNGLLVTDVMGAPQGLGAVGVYIYTADEVDLSKLIEFFD
jgi:hypothetical protein